MKEKGLALDEKEGLFSDTAMALIGIISIVPILVVFKCVLDAIANGTLFWPM